MNINVPQSKAELDKLLADANAILPYTEDTSVLKTPIKVKNKVLHNRIVYQAMEGCDGTKDGAPDDLTIRRYTRFAKGAPALIWFEATAVMQEGRANPRQMYLNDKTADDFRRMVEMIKELSMKENGFEPVVICQLTHSGRYSKPEGKPAPRIAYNNPIFEGENPIPKEAILSDDELDRICEALINGAKMAEQVGFDGADIKCCHRYLLCELLSAYEREGRYGGSFENRTRLVRTAAAGAIASCSDDFIITSRMNIYDGFPYPYGFGVNEGDGITPHYEEAKMLAKALVELGMPMLDFTMGNPYFNPNVNRPFIGSLDKFGDHPMFGVERMLKGIGEVKKAVPGIPVISSGISFLGTEGAKVNAACIENGMFDLAGFGRQTLAYPDCAKDITMGEGLDKKKICIACGKCSEIMRAGGTPGCVIRDTEMFMPLYRELVLNKK
ncbi:MAG: flavin oxidoreductase/NADH oxidase [Clostridia bacterium]|nr:flavin oxidoreductase/NADH oxidase [Clostridia bacterium]